MMKYSDFFKFKQSYFFKKCRYAKVEFYSYKAYKQENNLNLVPLIQKLSGKGHTYWVLLDCHIFHPQRYPKE